MALIWFNSPTQTTPPMTMLSPFEVHVEWQLDHKSRTPAKVRLTGTGGITVTPNPVYTVQNTETTTTFTVTCSAPTTTLTVELFPNGNLGGTPASTDTVDLVVQEGGMKIAPAAAELPIHRQQPENQVERPTDQAQPRGVPVVLTGLSTTAAGDHADAVVCIVYRKPQGIMRIEFTTPGQLLPKDGLVVVLDPLTRGRYYFLSWVDELGNPLEIRGGRIPSN